MARRKKRTPIPVETCPFAAGDRHRLERLADAARRLTRHSPERVDQLVALAEAHAANYEHGPESEDMVQARIRRILGNVEAN